MKNSPAIFLKLLVLLIPREMQVEHSETIKQMSDQQIEDAISAIQQMLAAREAKVIEGVSEPMPAPALPALQRKRRKAEGRDPHRPPAPR